MSFKFISLLYLISTAEASLHQITQVSNIVSFTAKGRPALIAIKGEGTGVEGKFQNKDGILSGDFKFPLSNLRTGIELRDEHMLNTYLEVKDYPEARLKIENVVTARPGEEFIFNGELTLHGVTQKVEGKSILKEDSLSAKLKIKLSDYKISIPSFQGITVAEEIEIEFTSNVSKLEE